MQQLAGENMVVSFLGDGMQRSKASPVVRFLLRFVVSWVERCGDAVIHRTLTYIACDDDDDVAETAA